MRKYPVLRIAPIVLQNELVAQPHAVSTAIAQRVPSSGLASLIVSRNLPLNRAPNLAATALNSVAHEPASVPAQDIVTAQHGA